MKKRIWVILICCLSIVPPCSSADKTPAKPASKKQDLQHFDTINLSGVGNLYIKQTDQENFTLEADDTVLPLIKVTVQDKTLYIDLANASDHLRAKINYYLNIKTLNSITATGLTNVFITDGLQTDALTLSISGLGNEADININTKQLTAKIEGGAKVVATGVANNQTVSINGAGEFDGTKLAGDAATVSLNGTSIAKTNVTGNLTANIAGNAAVKYCGKPDITEDISDDGEISRLSGC